MIEIGFYLTFYGSIKRNEQVLNHCMFIDPPPNYGYQQPGGFQQAGFQQPPAYQQQPATNPGYPAQPGYPPQSGHAAQSGYPAQAGYPPQSGPGGYPPQYPNAAVYSPAPNCEFHKLPIQILHQKCFVVHAIVPNSFLFFASFRYSFWVLTKMYIL